MAYDDNDSSVWQRARSARFGRRGLIRGGMLTGAGLAGAALATSGTAYQGVFRNALADPFLLGVASGAALGAALGVVLPVEGSLPFGWVPLLAFAGAMMAVTLAYLAAKRYERAADVI